MTEVDILEGMRLLPSGRAGSVLTYVVVGLLVGHAQATVTQVDGTIVPVGGGMQAALDTWEPPAGSLDAVQDAAELPEIFRPRLSSPVVFLDMREGAGFENSFGWYNVGDDVQTPAGRAANLHPVMGCGVPMVAGPGTATQHGGNPAYYLETAEEGSTISVDFAAEQTAGRYKGGFIGFYLITPENNPSSTNCGDFKNGADGLSLFGFIYFTQKDLNNDGDFVHHLVYTSNTPDRYLFGFEDLFRGGDNDYEDMAMRIDGLTPPCVPQAEVCDGIDNDCDTLVDAADPDLTGVGVACTCDGISMTCDNGPRFGVCQAGVTACVAGGITCHGTGTGSSETCNGLDDNCNNMVDEPPVAGTGGACDGPDADLCPEGVMVCTMGGLACSDNTGPNLELCNNVDDDCDGTTDEGNPGGGGSCGSSLGVCTPGTLQCMNGGLVCTGGTSGGAEVCNGLDDDCDGVVDDMPTDVGQACGATDVGECAFGMTICTGGSLQCAGEVGPTPETCNLRDDDCDTRTDENPVDAGQPCGQSIGACDPGTFTCSNGTLVCTGGVGPTSEVCNNVDDDCDGVVDNDVPGEGAMCGGGSGPCSMGVDRCIDGVMECVGGTGTGTETCNNVDDDCDGLLDEGDLCAGGVCDNGTCAGPCLAGEFPCPAGRICVGGFCVADPCFNVNCPVDMDGNAQTCRDGACVTLCSTITCTGGLVCRGSDGLCVPDTCEYLPKCEASELCLGGTCVPDPCSGVTCPADQFCRQGSCVASCQGVQCASGRVCRDGVCVPTGCGVDCRDGQVCDPAAGDCVPDRCGPIRCSPLEVCEPLTGECIPDPCNGVVCPSGQACSFGQCGRSGSGAFVTAAGGGGCDAGGGGDGSGAALGAGLIALGLLLRRRCAVASAVLVTSVALLVAGCNVNEYCIACHLGDGDGGNGDGSGGDGGVGNDGGPGCDPLNIHPESCNNADDDCDSNVDETYDLQNDELNCGGCSIECNKPGAQTQCQAGSCAILGCFPGFNDRNGDITGPYATSDGCEYLCFASNGGVEACDTLDNDCDGSTDEGFNTVDDVDNCGQCGRRCEFFRATPHCVASMCVFDPQVDCAPGFHDRDGMQANGCEYACTPTGGGTESCDLVDNDCDGSVDETFDFMTDRMNCGRCGLTCQFPNAVASCNGGTCGFDRTTDCLPGFVDANLMQADGCEYACSPTNGGVEICDGVDNDCDAVADDNPVDAGGACASTSPPRGACVADGTLTCASGALVCTGATVATAESCDMIDNDCDGVPDDNVTRACYTGPMGTSGVGACRDGTETCAAGMFGACTGQVTPTSETCNGIDDNCDTQVDNAPGGGPIVSSCYTGAMGTAGVGTCRAGTSTCQFGAPGPCVGQVVPAVERCGDTLDTDCDNLDDTQEGCLVSELEDRLDAGGGALGESSGGANHSYDLVLARGGASRVYAAWSQLVGSTTEVYVRRSDDGGQTWGTIVNVTSNQSTTSVKPQLAVAPGASDRVVVAYQTVTGGVRDIIVQVSTDSGATFGSPSSALDSSGDSFHHAIAIRGTTVVVTWEKLDTGNLNRDVMSRASTNGGSSFGAERKINTSTGTRFAGRPQVGITPSGGVVWVWREQRTGATRDIFAAAAPDTSTTPATNTRIDGDTMDRRDSDFPLLVLADSSVYLVWQDVSTQAGGGADAMFARSTDGGATWGAEVIIDDPAGEVSSSFTPSISVDARAAGSADDLVAIAWEDRRQGTQIYTSVSANGGASFTQPVRASNETGDPIAGETTRPAIIAATGGVLAVAYQNRVGTAFSHVFVATSIDGGASWTYTHDLLDGGAGPAMIPQVTSTLIGGQPAAVIGWTDFRANQIRGDIYTAVAH